MASKSEWYSTDKGKECHRSYYKIYRQKYPSKYLWLRAKERSKKAEMEFDLTPEDIVIPDTCPVLGIPLNINQGKRGARDNSPTLDRLDNNRGYTKDNINVISWRANDLKANGTLEEFERLVDWLRKVGKTSTGL